MYSTDPHENRSFLIPENAADTNVLDFIQIQKKINRKIVVVVGLGFVGTATCCVVANAKNLNGEPLYGVIGVDQATPDSFWKIALVNSGICPIKADDHMIESFFSNAVEKQKNLIATYDLECIKYADYILIDINLDVIKNKTEIEVPIEKFKLLISQIGKKVSENAVIIIETTVPPGTCERVIMPILRQEFKARKINSEPLLAHSYERVMPGRHYINSIINFWRVFSGTSRKAKDLTKLFLSSFINTNDYPLTELDTPTESETAKVLENSYRANNIAFIQEWTEFAERAGINLYSVVSAIKKRKGTHDNMMRPGFGVGGYCLPKDPLLAQWSSKELFDLDVDFELSKRAVTINDKMPLHSFRILKGCFPDIRGMNILLCGVSYLPDVSDIRNTPTRLLAESLLNAGANVFAHDPLLTNWNEVAPGNFNSDRAKLSKEIQVIFYLVNHNEYLHDSALKLKEYFPKLELVIDSFDILTDLKIEEYLKSNIQVKGVGKGHISNLLERI